MSFIDDMFGKNGIVKKGAGAARAIPGVGGALGGIVDNVIGEREGAPPPVYEKFTYDENAFKPSVSSTADDMSTRAYRNQVLATGNLGQQDSGMFRSNLERQEAAAAGTAPSIAEMSMQRQVAQNNAQQQSAAGSARGQGAMMLANMNASNQVNANNRDAAYAGQIARAQEMDMARKGLFGAINEGRNAAITGQEVMNRGVLGADKVLQDSNQFNSNMAIGLQDRNASQHGMVQGSVRNNYTDAQSADRYAEDAARAESAATTNQGMQIAGGLASSGKLDGMFAPKLKQAAPAQPQQTNPQDPYASRV